MRTKMVRGIVLTMLMAFLALGVGASSCEQKVEQDFGVKTQTDPATGKQTVTVDPSGGPVGGVVKAAADVASAIPGPGTLISLGLNGALVILTGILGSIARSRAGQLTTTQAGLAAANTAINATATGLQAAANTLPASTAATLVHIIDLAHDAAGVAGHLQDLIQPSLQTAGSTTPVPDPAAAAAVPKAA